MSSHGKNSCYDSSESQRPLSVWLAGRLQQEAYQSMAERIAWDVSEPNGRSPTLVIYEPATGITIGRLGSHTSTLIFLLMSWQGKALQYVSSVVVVVLYSTDQGRLALPCLLL